REMSVETSRSDQARSGRKIIVMIGLVGLLAGGGALYWQWTNTKPPDAPAGRPAGRAAVPVSIVIAGRQDVPIYATGLGTVQASFTVGIHSQVDGKLAEVLFTEGQHVKQGDVLARIDPRLYQAALDQSKAKKAQDVAMLIAAEKDLTRFKTLALKNFES